MIIANSFAKLHFLIILGVLAMRQGTFKLVDHQKGYGLIVSDTDCKDVFVTIRELERIGIRRICEGQRFSYEVYDKPGRNTAGNFAII